MVRDQSRFERFDTKVAKIAKITKKVNMALRAKRIQ
jgi:hypothetical protein